MAPNAGMAAMTKHLAAGMKLDRAVSARGFQLTDAQVDELNELTRRALELERQVSADPPGH